MSNFKISSISLTKWMHQMSFYEICVFEMCNVYVKTPKVCTWFTEKTMEIFTSNLLGNVQLQVLSILQQNIVINISIYYLSGCWPSPLFFPYQLFDLFNFNGIFPVIDNVSYELAGLISKDYLIILSCQWINVPICVWLKKVEGNP